MVSFICLLFLIQFPSDVNANDDNVSNDEDIINYFQDYYSSNDIDVLVELNKMIQEYDKISQYEEIDNRLKALDIISTLQHLRDNVSDYFENMYNRETPSRILIPDPLIDPSDVVIAAIIVYFNTNGWNLSAELLSHAWSNTVIDSIYNPIHGNIISQSGQVQTISSNIGYITGSYYFTIEEDDTISEDLYYSIRQCQYEKIYYDEDEITFHLRDRYDFSPQNNMYDSLFNFALGTMYNYQQSGILTPFITNISTTISGVVPFTYYFTNGNAIIDFISDYVSNLNVPTQILNINSYVNNSCAQLVNVTVIDDSAGFGCENLTSITLPNTITSINSCAFYNCLELENIILSNSLISIGNFAFKGCTNLETIILPTTVTNIGSGAFEGCTSLEEIEIPTCVASIGYNAFKNCTSLSSIEIKRTQKDLTTLGTNAFQGCSSLTEIIVPRDRIADYKNSSGWSSYRSLIIPNNSDYPSHVLNKYSNFNLPNYNIDAGYNIMYQLNDGTNYGYIFTITSGTNPIIKLYNSSFVLIDSDNSSIEAVLQSAHTYYLSVEHSDITTSGVISVNIQKDPNHVHIYNDYIWYSYTQHQKKCSCGTSGGYEPHAVSQGSLQPGQQYATCLLCGGLASVGFIGPFGNNEYPTTVNGSYILPNGVVVLAIDDIDAYLDGTLVFNYPNIGLPNSNNVSPYFVRKEDEY